MVQPIISLQNGEAAQITPNFRDYKEPTEEFLTKRGVFIPELTLDQKFAIKGFALNFWLNNDFPNLEQMAWVHGYCMVLNIELLIPSKPIPYEPLDLISG